MMEESPSAKPSNAKQIRTASTVMAPTEAAAALPFCAKLAPVRHALFARALIHFVAIRPLPRVD
jgi:hypothetical protein